MSLRPAGEYAKLRQVRARTGLLPLLAGLVAWPGSALAADKSPEVTVTFSGHYTSSMQNYLGVKDTSSANLSWSASATGPADQISFGKTFGSANASFNVGGDLTATVPPPNQEQSCSGNLSPVPGSIVAVLVTGRTLRADGIAPVVPTEVRSNQTTGSCAMGPMVGTPYTIGGFAAAQDPRRRTWFEPTLVLRRGRESASMTWSFSDSGPAGSGTENVNGTDTLTISLGTSHHKHKKHKKHGHKHPKKKKRGHRKRRRRGRGALVCRVPALRGKTVAVARRLLARGHCRLGRVRISGAKGKVPAGARVVAQAPPARSVRRRGARVNVTVRVRSRR